jgi:hypothetical protein
VEEMKRMIALLLTILFLSSVMALAQEGEAADQEISDSPVSDDIAGDSADDIFSALSALNDAESKSNPYGFLFVPAGSSSAMWLKKIDDDQLIIVTFTLADDGSVLTESMSAGNNISEMLLVRDYTKKAVALSMTYSNVRFEQTFVVSKLTDEQFSQYMSDFMENPADENFMEKLAVTEEIKMGKYSFKFPLQKGSKGDGVKFVQLILIELECLAGKADGDFGNKTKAAIEKYQEDNNMEVTGALDLYGFIKMMGG